MVGGGRGGEGGGRGGRRITFVHSQLNQLNQSVRTEGSLSYGLAREDRGRRSCQSESRKTFSSFHFLTCASDVHTTDSSRSSTQPFNSTALLRSTYVQGA